MNHLGGVDDQGHIYILNVNVNVNVECKRVIDLWRFFFVN